MATVQINHVEDLARAGLYPWMNPTSQRLVHGIVSLSEYSILLLL